MGVGRERERDWGGRDIQQRTSIRGHARSAGRKTDRGLTRALRARRRGSANDQVAVQNLGDKSR